MSSILNALKKLEQSSPSPRGPDGQSGNPHRSARSSRRSSGVQDKKWLLFGAVAFLLIVTAAGTWYFFADKDQSVHPVAAKTQPDPKPEEGKPAPASPARNDPTPKTPPPRPAARPETSSTAAVPAAQKVTANRTAAQKTAKQPLPKKGPAASTQTVESSVSPPVDSSSTDFLPKLDDTDIKLQAVSWTEIPEKRMAVINSKILREGESVEGYTVVRIGEDGVVLGKGGQSWRLTIRLK